jgi:hypothetical protein
MKKFLLGAMLTCMPAFSATLICGQDISINGGAAQAVCPTLNQTPGFTLTVNFIGAIGSWQDSSPSFTGSSTFNFTENSAQLSPVNPFLSGTAAGMFSANTGLLQFNVGQNFNPLNGFTVDATRIINNGGTPNSSTVTVFIDYTETQTGGVPEPSTVALVGGALVALGLVRRRK